MITKELFEQIIELQQEADTFIDKLEDMGLNLYDTPIFNTYGYYLDMLLTAYFTMEGHDWVNWYLFEKAGNSEMKAYNEDESEIKLETLDDLWELIKNYRV